MMDFSPWDRYYIGIMMLYNIFTIVNIFTIINICMLIVSETFVIIIFIVIVLIALFIAFYYDSHDAYDSSKIHIFIAVFIAFGIMIAFIYYYNIIAIQGQEQELAIVEELVRLNDNVLNNTLIAINEASIIIPNFVLSITPLTNTVCCGSTGCTVPDDPVTPQTCTQKATLSYRIFSVWQDIIVSNQINSFDPMPYIIQFLQRANSQQLYLQWNVTKLDFNIDTQTFGDLLFEYGLPITEQIPQSYIDAANELMADPRYQGLFD